MARAYCQLTAFREASNGVLSDAAGRVVTLYESDGVTLFAQTLYDALTGGNVVANPVSLNADGVKDLFVATPQYGVVKIGTDSQVVAFGDPAAASSAYDPDAIHVGDAAGGDLGGTYPNPTVTPEVQALSVGDPDITQAAGTGSVTFTAVTTGTVLTRALNHISGQIRLKLTRTLGAAGAGDVLILPQTEVYPFQVVTGDWVLVGYGYVEQAAGGKLPILALASDFGGYPSGAGYWYLHNTNLTRFTTSLVTGDIVWLNVSFQGV